MFITSFYWFGDCSLGCQEIYDVCRKVGVKFIADMGYLESVGFDFEFNESEDDKDFYHVIVHFTNL